MCSEALNGLVASVVGLMWATAECPVERINRMWHLASHARSVD